MIAVLPRKAELVDCPMCGRPNVTRECPACGEKLLPEFSSADVAVGGLFAVFFALLAGVLVWVTALGVFR